MLPPARIGVMRYQQQRHPQLHVDAADGEIIVADTDITKLSRGKLADWRAAHIGYIFQTHNLIPVLTAYENVELPLLLLPMSGELEHVKRSSAR